MAAPLLTGAFGLFLILLSAGKSGLNSLYKADGKETEGTIVFSDLAYDTHHMPHNNVTYQFTLPDGRTFRSSQTGYSGKHGDRILIQYLERHPSYSRVAGSQQQEEKWIVPIGVLGILMIVIALQSLRSAMRQPHLLAGEPRQH